MGLYQKNHNMKTGVANIQDIKMIITEAFVHINDTHGHLAVIVKNTSIASTIHLTSYIRNFTEESYLYVTVKAEKLLKLHIIKGSTGESTYNETHISIDLTKWTKNDIVRQNNYIIYILKDTLPYLRSGLWDRGESMTTRDKLGIIRADIQLCHWESITDVYPIPWDIEAEIKNVTVKMKYGTTQEITHEVTYYGYSNISYVPAKIVIENPIQIYRNNNHSKVAIGLSLDEKFKYTRATAHYRAGITKNINWQKKIP